MNPPEVSWSLEKKELPPLFPLGRDAERSALAICDFSVERKPLKGGNGKTS
jgi:hypothetical protein